MTARVSNSVNGIEFAARWKWACSSASGPVVARCSSAALEDVADVRPVNHGSQLAVFAIGDGRGRDRRHVFGHDRGAGLDLKMLHPES